MDQIAIQNLVPKFLEFYHHAKKEKNPDERWKLWEKYYHFAAVPPGKEGYQLARELLDASWEQYSDVIAKLESWAPDTTAIHDVMKRLRNVLHDNEHEPLELTIVYFVGNFEGNAFAAPTEDGGMAICLPVEIVLPDIILAHEVTHIIHAKKAGLSMQAERYIASIIMEEGLATRVSQLMVPGKSDQEYIEIEPGWLAKCEHADQEIFKGILPFLNKSDIDTVNKFTIGTGTTGLTREAYYVGWKLIGFLMDKGVKVHKLLELDEDEIRAYIEETMLEYMSE